MRAATREEFEWTSLIGRELKQTDDPYYVKVPNYLGIPALHRFHCKGERWVDDVQKIAAVDEYGVDWVELAFLGEQAREVQGAPRGLQFCWVCMVRDVRTS